MNYTLSLASRRSSQLSALALLAFAAGCGSADEQLLAEASVASALESTSHGAFSRTVSDAEPALGSCLDPEALAALAASRPPFGLYPESCVDKAVDGATLSLTLDGCTGVFGRAELDGSVRAELSAPSCDVVHAELEGGDDLENHGRPLDYGASVDVLREGEALRARWLGAWSGTTRRGFSITHTSDLDLVHDLESGCLRVDGSTEGEVRAHSISSTLTGLEVCPGQCPSKGTVAVEVAGRRGERGLVITFDGSSTAKVEGERGAHEVELACGE